MTDLVVTDLSIDLRAVCEDCGWLDTADDADYAESNAAQHAVQHGHRVRVISKFVQIYEGRAA